ncbi:uncharacterized protein LOC116701895 [Etheostoma spectabile]|uniref:uncharacterized protein LOC116701895 n=1 Tax=Etheostoma spectabile TaxID=54343 RepID=UPI0013AFE1A5|nr:uncharacterized protein LOC116701895 [Etheostoma spectabile]
MMTSPQCSCISTQRLCTHFQLDLNDYLLDEKLTDDLQNADELLAELQKEKAALPARTSTSKVRWRKRDSDGNVLYARPRSRRNQSEKAGDHTPNPPCNTADHGPNSASETASKTISAECLVQDLQYSLSVSDDEIQEAAVDQGAPLASVDWSTRNALFFERWRAKRPYLVNSMLAQGNVETKICSQCGINCAAVRCRDCLPCPFLCAECDISRHNKTYILHNRDAMCAGFFQPLPPTSCVVDNAVTHCVRLLPIEMPVQICRCPPEALRVIQGKAVALVTINGRYDLNMPELSCEGCQATWTAEVDDLIQSGYWPATLNFATVYEEDLFFTFESMKMASPGMSCQAFLRMLEKRTVRFGRTGKLSSDSFQKSFFEWAAVQYEVDAICKEEQFSCPACTPAMLAVSVDGNRKLYRFKSTARSEERPIFDGVFIANDEDVTRFVDQVHTKTKHVTGKGICGGEWLAARETSCRSRSKVDEEGLELAVCRHGVLLSALNMFRGEIYAYPMFILTEPACAQVKWSGANQDGAGSTLGEEVEQCNAFLSRIAVTTKHMSKAGRNDMLTLLSMRWNQQKFQNLANSLSQRYHKLGDLETLKAKLQLQEKNMEEFVQDVKDWADGAVDFSTKKEVFDRVMAVRRLQEEKKILVKEIKQHWDSLKSHARVLSEWSFHQSENTQGHLTENAKKGVTCLIRRRLRQMKELQRRARKVYLHVLSNPENDNQFFCTTDSSDEFDFSSESSDSDVDAM